MVSYYNSLAMFPNARHAPQSSSPAAAAAAAAAAYLGYHGYHHPHHHHHLPHHHVHPQGSPPAAPAAPHHPHQHHHMHHNMPPHLHQYPGENHESGGGGGSVIGGNHAGMNHLGGGHQHHQYAPPTPPSQYDPHHHIPHHLIQHHAHQETEGSQTGSPQPLGTPVSWHSPAAYATQCSRGGTGPEAGNAMTGGAPYEGWSPQSLQPTMGTLNSNGGTTGTPPPPSSVTPDYKMTPGLDFPGGGSPTMMGMSQQPQDLSNGSGPPPAIPISTLPPGLVGPPQHASPDSGLAASSDGVSSSAGSPQHIHQLGQHHGHHVQMGGQQQQMQMQTLQPVQQSALLQTTELRQLPHQQAPQPQAQGRHPGQGDQQQGQQQQQQHRPQPVRSPYEWMKKPSYQSQPNPGKTRTKDKYRVVYSDRQRLELEKEFHYSRYITIRRKSELATALGLSDRQVKIWFQNRRAKERKHLKKREDVVSKEKMVEHPEGPQGPTRGGPDQTQVALPEQMPTSDLMPNQLHMAPHQMHTQHHHMHHPHHGDMSEAPPQGQQAPPPQQQQPQQQTGMVMPLTAVTIGGVDL
ncbi:homeotic protein caudal-like isoform X2 [Ischnura elegans]|uniref:homeotic protein caudal-like isoform X2 n=1 Tax=Ischnura elegans TaxID=197161 RepID=UPI001ED86E75|nr:homeotic protein caudal-like isoform X2 [Ischnura elegans]